MTYQPTPKVTEAHVTKAVQMFNLHAGDNLPKAKRKQFLDLKWFDKDTLDKAKEMAYDTLDAPCKRKLTHALGVLTATAKA
jgi:hypothetical protein